MRTQQIKWSTLSAVLLPLAALLLSAGPASADIVWDWSYKCGKSTGRCKGGGGTFTIGDEQGSGTNAYDIINALTGTVEGNTITALLPPDSLGRTTTTRSICLATRGRMKATRSPGLPS